MKIIILLLTLTAFLNVSAYVKVSQTTNALNPVESKEDDKKDKDKDKKENKDGEKEGKKKFKDKGKTTTALKKTKTEKKTNPHAIYPTSNLCNSFSLFALSRWEI